MTSTKRLFFTAALCVAHLLCPDDCVADGIVYFWPKVPLEIDLAVGSEQRITVPEAEALRIDVPQTIKSKLRAQILGNHLWLSANEPFPTVRLVLLAEPLGRVIFEVRAQQVEQFNQPIIIQASENSELKPTESGRKTLGFVTLTRWVIQQLYAPKRLLTDLPGVLRLPIDFAKSNIFRCASRTPTLCAGGVTAQPIAAWQSPHHFITALKITNTLSNPVTLDPRELSGTWLSASFVHNQLYASGHPGDTTALVVISQHPYEIAQP